MALKILDKISEKTHLGKKTLLVMFAGLLGIILLIVSELLPEKTAENKKNEDISGTSYEQYAENIEEKLSALISQIDGAGEAKVMVTLECSDESVYAREQKSEDGGETNKYEDNYIIVKTDNGEEGMLLKVTQPKIRGVAIVCRGGNSPQVRQSITDTVTAVLDISSARVNIAAMKNNNGG